MKTLKYLGIHNSTSGYAGMIGVSCARGKTTEVEDDIAEILLKKACWELVNNCKEGKQDDRVKDDGKQNGSDTVSCKEPDIEKGSIDERINGEVKKGKRGRKRKINF